MSALHNGIENEILDTEHQTTVKFDLFISKPSQYPGQGTKADPFVVDWDLTDIQNPYNWTKFRKWVITTQLAFSTFTVSFGSSSYTGGISLIMRDFGVSQEIALLGVTFYVVGFGFGPLLFAPMSETYGRRIVFLCTYSVYTLCHLGGSLGKNITTVLVTRLLSGMFGSAPLSNASAVISDIWTPRERGFAASLYAVVPFLGPAFGPVVGGYVSMVPKLGWRFIFWILVMMSASIVISSFIFVPETYGPILLRRRARKLRQDSKEQQYYVSKYDLKQSTSFIDVLRVNMSRPFVFMYTEPIVVAAALYISVVFAVLYSFLAAFPIIFQEHRGFNAGQGGLAFMGVAGGVIFGLLLVPIQNKYYRRAMDASENGRAPPEARLYAAMVGGVLAPIGLFWLAWTSQPQIHWIVPILSGAPFGCAISQIMPGFTQYLIDTYTIYCASAIASTVVLRCIFAAVFPLLCPLLFKKVGDQWGVSLFAFMALACTPLHVLIFRYGRWMRSKSLYAYKDDSNINTTRTSGTETLVQEKDVADLQTAES